MHNVTVVDNAQKSQFEALTEDGTVAGFVTYDADVAGEGAVVVIHTVVDPEFEGRGVGGRLAHGALDLIRASGRGVVPLCPFVASYIRRHPEYQDLVRPAPDTAPAE